MRARVLFLRGERSLINKLSPAPHNSDTVHHESLEVVQIH